MSIGNVEQMTDKLYDIILSLKTKDDCREFFADLCTNKEIEQMSQRVRAAELLKDGKTYTQVSGELDISSATLARVSRSVQYGKGYKKFIK